MNRFRAILRAAGLAAAAGLVPGCDDDVNKGGQFSLVTVRVSVDATGAQVSGDAFESSISGDGRYVAFTSSSSTLSDGDTNGVRDVFIKDRLTGLVRNITNIADQGFTFLRDCETPSISSNGKFVAFVSTGNYNNDFNLALANTIKHVFVYDVDGDVFRSVYITLPDRDEAFPTVTNDGRYVAYQTAATNTGFPNPGGTKGQIYVCDMGPTLSTRLTLLVSRDEVTPAQGANGGSALARITPDGAFVVFTSGATNLINALDADTNGDVYRWQRAGGAMTLVSASAPSGGSVLSVFGSVSDDGNRIAYTHRTNAAQQEIWLTDLLAATTVPISDPGIFTGSFDPPAISGDGRSVIYVGSSPTSTFAQVYTWDAAHGNRIISTSAAGVQGNKTSFRVSISGDGQWGCWETGASNLVAGDTNGSSDIYVAGTLR